MVKFMKKLTKLALKSAAVCTGIAAGVALLHKYVKIQSNCCECNSKEDNFDEDKDADETQTTDSGSETAEDESDAISSDEATDSSSRRYINIHVTGQNSGVDINIDKGQLLDDAAKLVADAAHLTKNLMPGSHNAQAKDEAFCEQEEDDSFCFTDIDNDIEDLDIDDLDINDPDIDDPDTDDDANDPVNSSIHL